MDLHPRTTTSLPAATHHPRHPNTDPQGCYVHSWGDCVGLCLSLLLVGHVAQMRHFFCRKCALSAVEQARTLTLPLFIVSLDDLLLPNHDFQVAHTSFIKFYQVYDFFAHARACFGSSPPTWGCHPPPSTGNHTPPPSPGLVPSLSMPCLPPPPRATLMSSCHAHVPT